MSFFQDMVSVFKKREISFLERHKLSEDVYTFVFEKDKDLPWKAGQHSLFIITHKKIKTSTKPFTIASAPDENVIKITTRTGENPSDFKKALLELEKGMSIKMTGPLGKFYLEDSSPALFIAGGMGITPFRSILKQVDKEGYGIKEPINLLYMDSQKSYLFKDELDEYTKNPLITINYLSSRDDLQKEVEKFADQFHNNGKYFIAGPKSMVESITTQLQNKKIPKKNIKKDAFYGY